MNSGNSTPSTLPADDRVEGILWCDWQPDGLVIQSGWGAPIRELLFAGIVFGGAFALFEVLYWSSPSAAGTPVVFHWAVFGFLVFMFTIGVIVYARMIAQHQDKLVIDHTTKRVTVITQAGTREYTYDTIAIRERGRYVRSFGNDWHAHPDCTLELRTAEGVRIISLRSLLDIGGTSFYRRLKRHCNEFAEHVPDRIVWDDRSKSK